MIKTAIIIKGNASHIKGNSNFYKRIKRYLEKLGYKVKYDNGKPYTKPSNAYLWVGHSLGSDRLEGAVPKYARKVLGIGVPDAKKQPFKVINHPRDNFKVTDGKYKPSRYHFIFTKEMKDYLKKI